MKCSDEKPAKIKIVRPKENYLYVFDREITPHNGTMIIGGITVVAESNSSNIKRVEFYTSNQFTYDYRPRAIRYNLPYEWKCRKLGAGFRSRITVAAYYGNAGAVAVDKIIVYIIM